MKRIFVIFLLLSVLLSCPVMAETLSDEDVRAAVMQEYPDWKIWRTERYGSGVWQDESAQHSEVGLFRLSEEHVEIMRLHAILNPLKKGDTIPWEETKWVSVPITREASQLIATMPPEEVAAYGAGFAFSEAVMPFCAAFILEEGMAWQSLIAYPDFLVGIARQDGDLLSLRIARWDGTKYVEMSASIPQKVQMGLNFTHSFNDALELFVEELQLYIHQDVDGIWKMAGFNTGMEVVNIHGNGLEDITWGSETQNNNNFHYGYPLFKTNLEEVEWRKLPQDLAQGVALLDVEGWACTKTNQALLYDAPEGNIIATCYARAAGQVKETRDGWTCLQLGSDELGLSGWFNKNDLAFGKETEEIVCGFPSYARQENEAQHLKRYMPDISIPLEDYYNDVWLIGQNPSGDWLVCINRQQVLFAPGDTFSDIGPTVLND